MGDEGRVKDGKKRFLTIKKEIFLLSFISLSIVSLIFACVFLRILYTANVDNARNSLRECNSQIVTYAESMFHENAAVVGILSRDDTVIHGGYGNPQAVLDIYGAIQADNSNITYIYSGYEDGNLYISDYDTPSGYSPMDRPWYEAAMETDGVARLAYSDAATGEWLFSQCKKLVDQDGENVGVVSIDCSNDSISRQLSARYQYKSQRSYIMDMDGNVIIHPEERYIDDTLMNYIDTSVWEAVVEGTTNYGEYEKDGVNAMAYFERIPDTGFFVATAIDASEVLLPIVHGVILLVGLVIFISVILGFVLGRVLIYRFARPIMALRDRIEKVADGCPEDNPDLGFTNAEINGIADSIEVIVLNMGKREEMQKAAEYLSFHDSMTGLYNRRYFAEELKRLDTPRNYPLCAVCCDVNGLKLVNDVFGHDVGDRLIGRVARCLECGCREDDILARIGGDEFAILMPRTTAEDARKIISRIRLGFPKENICGAEVSASLGYAVKAEGTESMEDILHKADRMMYEEKLMESVQMKRDTVDNIIRAAQGEGLITRLSRPEEEVLGKLAEALCPDSAALLKQGYQLRRIGMCSLFRPGGPDKDGMDRGHTEHAYRLLSSLEEYRNIAACLLHYTEHWDGSGWPVGLAGRDIPLLSRIIAAADAYFASGEDGGVFEENASWYDPDIVGVLLRIMGEQGQ